MMSELLLFVPLALAAVVAWGVVIEVVRRINHDRTGTPPTED
jgi:hypothetical protein